MSKKVSTNHDTKKQSTSSLFDFDSSLAIAPVQRVDGAHEVLRPLILDGIDYEIHKDSAKELAILHNFDASMIDTATLNSSIQSLMELEQYQQELHRNINKMKKKVANIVDYRFLASMSTEQNSTGETAQDVQNTNYTTDKVILQRFGNTHVNFSFQIPAYSSLYQHHHDLSTQYSQQLSNNSQSNAIPQTDSNDSTFSASIPSIYTPDHVFSYNLTLFDMLSLLPTLSATNIPLLTRFEPNQLPSRTHAQTHSSLSFPTNFTIYPTQSDPSNQDENNTPEFQTHIERSWGHLSTFKYIHDPTHSKTNQYFQPPQPPQPPRSHPTSTQHTNSSNATSKPAFVPAPVQPPLIDLLPPSVIISTLFLTITALIHNTQPNQGLPYPYSPILPTHRYNVTTTTTTTTTTTPTTSTLNKFLQTHPSFTSLTSQHTQNKPQRPTLCPPEIIKEMTNLLKKSSNRHYDATFQSNSIISLQNTMFNEFCAKLSQTLNNNDKHQTPNVQLDGSTEHPPLHALLQSVIIPQLHSITFSSSYLPPSAQPSFSSSSSPTTPLPQIPPQLIAPLKTLASTLYTLLCLSEQHIGISLTIKQGYNELDEKENASVAAMNSPPLEDLSASNNAISVNTTEGRVSAVNKKSTGNATVVAQSTKTAQSVSLPDTQSDDIDDMPGNTKKTPKNAKGSTKSTTTRQTMKITSFSSTPSTSSSSGTDSTSSFGSSSSSGSNSSESSSREDVDEINAKAQRSIQKPTFNASRDEKKKDNQVNKVLTKIRETAGYLSSTKPPDTNNGSKGARNRLIKAEKKYSLKFEDDSDESDQSESDGDVDEADIGTQHGLLSLSETAPNSLHLAYHSITKAYLKKIGTDVPTCAQIDLKLAAKYFAHLPSAERLIVTTFLSHRYITPLASCDNLDIDYSARLRYHDVWELTRIQLEKTILRNDKPSRVYVPITHNPMVLRSLSKDEQEREIKKRVPQPGDAFLTPPALIGTSSAYYSSHSQHNNQNQQNRTNAQTFQVSQHLYQVAQSHNTSASNLIYCPLRVWDLLLKHQQIGVQWLTLKYLQGQGAILADEMGLGKSVQIGAFLASQWYSWYLGSISAPFTSLLVVPASLITLWLNELHIWCPEVRLYTWIPTGGPHQLDHHGGSSISSTATSMGGPNDEYLGFGIKTLDGFRQNTIRSIVGNKSRQCSVLIVSYNTCTTPTFLSFAETTSFTHMILDECQHVINPKTKSHQAMLKVIAKNKILLSGTPIQNSVEDLWSLLTIANIPLPFPYTKVHETLRKQRTEEDIRICTNLCHLIRASISPYILRRLKQSTVELPPQVHSIVTCGMKENQAMKYNDYVNMLTSLTKTGLNRFQSNRNKNVIFAGIGSLLRICTHPDLVQNGDSSVNAQNDYRLRELKKVQQLENIRQSRIKVENRLKKNATFGGSNVSKLSDSSRSFEHNAGSDDENETQSSKQDSNSIDNKHNSMTEESFFNTYALDTYNDMKSVINSNNSNCGTRTTHSLTSLSSKFHPMDSSDDDIGNDESGGKTGKSRKRGQGPKKGEKGKKSKNLDDHSFDFDDDSDDDVDMFDDYSENHKSKAQRMVSAASRQASSGLSSNSNPVPLPGDFQCVEIIKKSKCGLIGGYYDLFGHINQYNPEELYLEVQKKAQMLVKSDQSKVKIEEVSHLMQENKSRNQNQHQNQISSTHPQPHVHNHNCTGITCAYPCIREVPSHFYGSYHNSEKLQCILQLICSWLCSGKKVTVFSSSIKTLNMLCMHMRTTWLRIDGSTPVLQRSHITSLFNSGVCPILFASTRCVSEGITLTNTDKVILVNSSWNPGADAQCIARTHRLGRTKECHVYTMAVKNSMESYVLHTQHRKSLLADAILQGGSKKAATMGRGVDFYLKPYAVAHSSHHAGQLGRNTSQNQKSRFQTDHTATASGDQMEIRPKADLPKMIHREQFSSTSNNDSSSNDLKRKSMMSDSMPDFNHLSRDSQHNISALNIDHDNATVMNSNNIPKEEVDGMMQDNYQDQSMDQDDLTPTMRRSIKRQKITLNAQKHAVSTHLSSLDPNDTACLKVHSTDHNHVNLPSDFPITDELMPNMEAIEGSTSTLKDALDDITSTNPFSEVDMEIKDGSKTAVAQLAKSTIEDQNGTNRQEIRQTSAADDEARFVSMFYKREQILKQQASAKKKKTKTSGRKSSTNGIGPGFTSSEEEFALDDDNDDDDDDFGAIAQKNSHTTTSQIKHDSTAETSQFDIFSSIMGSMNSDLDKNCDTIDPLGHLKTSSNLDSTATTNSDSLQYAKYETQAIKNAKANIQILQQEMYYFQSKQLDEFKKKSQLQPQPGSGRERRAPKSSMNAAIAPRGDSLNNYHKSPHQSANITQSNDIHDPAIVPIIPRPPRKMPPIISSNLQQNNNKTTTTTTTTTTATTATIGDSVNQRQQSTNTQNQTVNKSDDSVENNIFASLK